MSAKKGLNLLLSLACLAFCVLLSGGTPARATAQDTLTPGERRGKQIYVQGTSPSGKEIRAYLGESSLEVPGSAMPCANCHGLDGRGKPEAGVTPSNLTWEALTKPYGVTHADGRQHPPYTERALELAITRGSDPAGNHLLNVMPRYVMAKEDLADLILYIKRLGEDHDPGISENKIVVATLIPKGALAEMGQAVKAVTSAFFDDLNNRGGVYNRRFELKFVETDETPTGKRADIERWLTNERVFAMTGAFIAGAEKEIVSLVAEKGVPLVGPITLYPQIGFPLNRQVFYLLSGVDGQARALVDFAAKKTELKAAGIAVVCSRSEINANIVKAIEDQSRKAGLSAPTIYDYAAGGLNAGEAIERLRRAGREAVFFLGSGDEVLSFMRAADKLGWHPYIFQPGSGGAEIFNAPVGFNEKLFFSVPSSPADQSATGIKEFYTLAEKYKLPRQHLAAQLSAYSAAKILVEALRRVGKDVSREKLIQALEGFYQYSTGVTPAIPYGPNRRIGAMGAYVVQIDLKAKRLLPASAWIEIN